LSEKNAPIDIDQGAGGNEDELHGEFAFMTEIGRRPLTALHRFHFNFSEIPRHHGGG
jgi:hypothetical protein